MSTFVIFQGVPSEEETLEAATRTLNLSDEAAPDAIVTSTENEPMDSHSYNTPGTVYLDLPISLNDSLNLSGGSITNVANVSTSSDVSEPDLSSLVSMPANDKKKKVTLADYRKRLQSRSGKPSSISNDKCEGNEATSPASHPVFEPISPVDPDKQSRDPPQNSIIEEFTRPSLSETVSDESMQPSKIRKLEFSSSVHDEAGGTKESVPSPRPVSQPDNGNPLYHTVLNGTSANHTPPQTHVLPEDTFSKIKEILSQSNPGLVPSNNLNVSQSILKTNLQMYDPNASSVKQYQYPSQYSDEMYNRENKRLKPSIGHSDYPSKYFKENEKR